MYWIITFWNRCTENISGSCYYLLCKICTLCYSYLHYQVICERFPHNKLNGSRNTRIAGTYFGNMEIWITLYCSRNIYKSMFITFKKKKKIISSITWSSWVLCYCLIKKAFFFFLWFRDFLDAQKQSYFSSVVYYHVTLLPPRIYFFLLMNSMPLTSIFFFPSSLSFFSLLQISV